MNTHDVSKRIEELAGVKKAPFETPLEQVEIALFIEDVFGFGLTDDDMTAARLGTFEAIEQLVLERLGLA